MQGHVIRVPNRPIRSSAPRPVPYRRPAPVPKPVYVGFNLSPPATVTCPSTGVTLAS